MARNRHTDDILNVNVSGKRYTVRRTNLLADPKSKLAEWFKPGTGKQIATDKGGNYYLDRDPKTFRHILAYLRLKKEKFVLSLALPAKPDDLAKCPKASSERIETFLKVKEPLLIELSAYDWEHHSIRLVAECEALNMVELKNLALDVLQKYQRTEEQHFVTSYVQIALRDYETWQFDHEQSTVIKKGKGGNAELATGAYDEWDNL